MTETEQTHQLLRQIRDELRRRHDRDASREAQVTQSLLEELARTLDELRSERGALAQAIETRDAFVARLERVEQRLAALEPGGSG